MKNQMMSVVLCATLAACSSSNPFNDNAETPVETPTDTGNPIASDRVLPPGTAAPSPARGLFRSEPTTGDTADVGDGFASNVSYDAANDTFSVDNLAFDGANVYQRGTAVSTLNGYSVYEADAQTPDTLTQRPINQFHHRAIYGVSRSGNTEFAIVRTGDYVPYGFGGFVYQRSNNVTLPTSGQALYTGQTAGIRDFDGAGGLNGQRGLQYTTANISIAIDFEDFNDSGSVRGDGVQGFLSNRRLFSNTGVDITEAVVNAINAENNADLEAIPNAVFTVGPNVLDNNGEIVGELTSRFGNVNGEPVDYEIGQYYAILSGEDQASELVGILVLENTAESSSVRVRETSGFILYR